MSASAMIGEAAEEEEEFGFTECECCGLTEECTAAYVTAVRARYGGRWICGLCAEVVDDEICRSARLISMEEALQRQKSFCLSFRSATFPPTTETGDHLIAVVRRLIRRSLDSPPRVLLSASASTSRRVPTVSGQSKTCLATIGDNYLSDAGDADLLEVKGLKFN
ncbi:uncharacterized protein LOC110029431 [Phalaenopsis equestris]|uniref:uncharacterized protein LOC110029431 n=1 Tax=Phalaenopsis equestris TaxID=78828 RepID=UPI0009E542D3|nr:uncharacterized protein LOC110029431 [Phalaenopsis equestris]